VNEEAMHLFGKRQNTCA